MSHIIDLGDDVAAMVDVLVDRVDSLTELDPDPTADDFDPVTFCAILEAIATVATAICSIIKTSERDGVE